MLAIDTLYLTGVAFLLSDHSKEAADVLGKAVQECQAAHPYQAAGLLLLLSDAQRRAGQTANAEATWQGAAQLAAELAAAPVPVSRPDSLGADCLSASGKRRLAAGGRATHGGAERPIRDRDPAAGQRPAALPGRRLVPAKRHCGPISAIGGWHGRNFKQPWWR